MIHEYALDPSLVARWGDGSTWSFYDGKFGVGTHRVPCLLPERSWRARVETALGEVLAALPDDTARQHARSNLTKRIERLMQADKYTWREGLPDDAPAWRAHVEHEHARRPLEAAVVVDRSMLSSRGGVPMLQHGAFTEASNSCWVKDRRTHRRTSTDIVAVLEPMLRCARSIRLVDPYFDPQSSSYVSALDEVVRASCARRSPSELPKIEVHTALDVQLQHGSRVYYDWRRDPNARAGSSLRLETAAVRELGVRMSVEMRQRHGAWPSGARVELVLWKKHRETMHNRYLLTEHGGVLLGAGYDTHSAPDATDDAALLSPAQYAVRSRLYSEKGTELTEVGRYTIAS